MKIRAAVCFAVRESETVYLYGQSQDNAEHPRISLSHMQREGRMIGSTC